MPPLNTEKQELFAQARARGLSLTAAAREAGYTQATAHVRGSELGKNPQVLARVQELRDRLDDRLVTAVTTDRVSILQNIGELVAEARAAKDRSTAMRGLELLGKAAGLFVDRHMEVKSPLEGLNADQLLAIIRLAEQVEAGTLDLQAVREDEPAQLAAPVEDAI